MPQIDRSLARMAHAVFFSHRFFRNPVPSSHTALVSSPSLTVLRLPTYIHTHAAASLHLTHAAAAAAHAAAAHRRRRRSRRRRPFHLAHAPATLMP